MSFPSDEEVEAAFARGELGGLIEDALSVLVGELWRYIGRAVDLTWIGFGKEVDAPSRRDPSRRLAEYSLHVQCPLRISQGTVPLLGSLDLHRQADDPYATPSDFDFDENRGNTLWDRRAESLNALLGNRDPVVARVASDPWGGLTIELTHDLRIVAFPWASYPNEAWRFFRSAGASDHLVIPSDRH